MLDSRFASNIFREHKLEVFLLVVLGGLFSYFYSLILQEEPPAPLAETVYVLQAHQVEIEDYWRDRKRWKILGQKALVTKNHRIVFLEEVKIWVYRPPPSPLQADVVVTAKQGIINWEAKTVTLITDVKMTRGAEMEVNAQQAIYHYQTGILHIPDEVDMHYLQDSVFGEALTYDVHQEKMELHRAKWLQ